MTGIVKGHGCKTDILILETKPLQGLVTKIFPEMTLVYEVFGLFSDWLISRNSLSVATKI